MAYLISDQCLNHIEDTMNDNALVNRKQEISKAIQLEWDKIFTVHPRLAFLVGILLLFITFAIDFYVHSFGATRQTYQFLVLIAASLTATSFCAGFTGSLNLDLKWVQSGGSLAIFVLVFTTSPLTFESKVSDDALQDMSALTLVDSLWITLNGVVLSSAIAQQSNEPNSTNEAHQNEGALNSSEAHILNYTRVYYPRGVAELKERAFELHSANVALSDRSEVYSSGSIFTAVTNNLRHENNDDFLVEVRYLPGLDQEKLDTFLEDLRQKGYPVESASVISDYSTQADIAVHLKIK